MVVCNTLTKRLSFLLRFRYVTGPRIRSRDTRGMEYVCLYLTHHGISFLD